MCTAKLHLIILMSAVGKRLRLFIMHALLHIREISKKEDITGSAAD